MKTELSRVVKKIGTCQSLLIVLVLIALCNMFLNATQLAVWFVDSTVKNEAQVNKCN